MRFGEALRRAATAKSHGELLALLHDLDRSGLPGAEYLAVAQTIRARTDELHQLERDAAGQKVGAASEVST